jgi:hypothetical protein
LQQRAFTFQIFVLAAGLQSAFSTIDAPLYVDLPNVLRHYEIRTAFYSTAFAEKAVPQCTHRSPRRRLTPHSSHLHSPKPRRMLGRK